MAGEDYVGLPCVECMRRPLDGGIRCSIHATTTDLIPNSFRRQNKEARQKREQEKPKTLFDLWDEYDEFLKWKANHKKEKELEGKPLEVPKRLITVE